MKRYEKMYAMGSSNKPTRCDEVLAQVEGILYTSFTAQLDSPSVKATCRLVVKLTRV